MCAEEVTEAIHVAGYYVSVNIEVHMKIASTIWNRSSATFLQLFACMTRQKFVTFSNKHNIYKFIVFSVYKNKTSVQFAKFVFNVLPLN